MTITFETTKEAKFKHIEMLKFLLERYIGATPIYYKDKNILVKFDNKKFDTDNLIEKIDFILRILWLGDNQLNLISILKN